MADEPAPVPLVVGHEPAWQGRGLALADDIRSWLAPLALQVEHIGSTAIPGMAAKPVFDMQVSVHDLQAAEDAFQPPLASHGFQRSSYRRDHVPAGCGDAPDRWAKRLWWRRGHPGGDVNLHVRVLGSPNERLALLFRDWFRAHPEAIPAYARFKGVLAGAVADLGTYSDVKDPVVDLVVAIAEPWAAATGWTPHAGPEPRPARLPAGARPGRGPRAAGRVYLARRGSVLRQLGHRDAGRAQPLGAAAFGEDQRLLVVLQDLLARGRPPIAASTASPSTTTMRASSLRTRCFDLSGSVYVRTVINTYDVDDTFGLIDAVNHPVSPTARGVIATQFAGKGLADPAWVVQ